MNAGTDLNHAKTLLGLSSTGDGTLIVPYVDPITHRLYVNSTGGGSGSVTVLVPTGTVNGVNQTFVFSSAPNVIVLDNGNTMNKVSSDGTVNWTGTTTVVLNQAPNFNIFGF